MLLRGLGIGEGGSLGGEGSLREEEPGTLVFQLTSHLECCPSSCVLFSAHPEFRVPWPYCGGHGEAPL